MPPVPFHIRACKECSVLFDFLATERAELTTLISTQPCTLGDPELSVAALLVLARRGHERVSERAACAY
jgi:hypothetical protein